MFNRRIRLPQTIWEFDALVSKVVKKYRLIDPHHAAAVISVAIRHLPTTQAYSTLDYFGQYIQKAIANHVADHKNNMMKHEAQVDQLASLLRQDPNDNQARDGLEKAANEGSEYAKKALEKLQPSESPLKVLQSMPN